MAQLFSALPPLPIYHILLWQASTMTIDKQIKINYVHQLEVPHEVVLESKALVSPPKEPTTMSLAGYSLGLCY